MEGGIPGVVGGKSSYEAGVSYERSYLDSTDDTQTTTGTLTIENTAILWAGQAAHCKTKIWQGRFDEPYIATQTITLKSGQTFIVKTKGQVTETTWFQGGTECQNIQPEDIPTDNRPITDPNQTNPPPKKLGDKSKREAIVFYA